MKASEHLRAMRELLAVPERWTQRATARTAKGKETNSWTRNARSWCLDGAFRRAAPKGQPEAWEFLKLACSDPILVRWNDQPDRIHAEVLALLDDAIALAESEGK